MSSLFPVIVYDKDTELPQHGTYYVIAGNGIFLRKEMPLISGFIQVNGISILPDLEVDQWVKSDIPDQHIDKIVVYDEGVELPKHGTYYVVAGNGFFIRKEAPPIIGFFRVEKIPTLPNLEYKQWVRSNIPQVPMQHIVRIKEFFRRVVDKFYSEACTVLYYNRSCNDWKVYVPPQVVSHAGVKYRRGQMNVGLPEYDGYLRVGTIHSHCDFGSFHSGTDVNDEMDFDGIHGTFGHNDKDDFSITASIVINGQRMEVDPLWLFDGIKMQGGDRYALCAAKEHQEFWIKNVDEWMSKITGASSEHADTICEKDRVIWVGNESSVMDFMRTEIGEGPFEVVGVEGDYLYLSTNCPDVIRLSKNLFKKV
jgi:hypothetical protein